MPDKGNGKAPPIQEQLRDAFNAAKNRFLPNVNVVEPEVEERSEEDDWNDHMEVMVRTTGYEEGLRPFLEDTIDVITRQMNASSGETLTRTVGIRRGVEIVLERLDSLYMRNT